MNLKFDAEQRYRYCEQLRRHGNKTRAAAACGVSTTTVLTHRKADPTFDEEVAEAMDAYLDGLEEEAARRARDGVPEPVFYKGVECGEVQRYSDSLLMFLLKGRRREVYGDKSQVELTGKDGGPVAYSDAERAQKVEELLKRAAERKALADGLC
jgi:hypothetical protein